MEARGAFLRRGVARGGLWRPSQASQGPPVRGAREAGGRGWMGDIRWHESRSGCRGRGGPGGAVSVPENQPANEARGPGQLWCPHHKQGVPGGSWGWQGPPLPQVRACMSSPVLTASWPFVPSSFCPASPGVSSLSPVPPSPKSGRPPGPRGTFGLRLRDLTQGRVWLSQGTGRPSRRPAPVRARARRPWTLVPETSFCSVRHVQCPAQMGPGEPTVMADFRAKRVSVLEGLLLLTHAMGLAARGAGEVAGLRRPQCRPRHGRGQTDPRFTWGERPRGAGAARRGWRSRGRLPRLRGSLCSPRSRTEEHGPGDGAGMASPPGGAGTAGCLRVKSEPRPGPRGLHQVSSDGPGPRREPPTRRRPAGCAEVGRRRGVQTAADAPGAPPARGAAAAPAARGPSASAVQTPVSRE